METITIDLSWLCIVIPIGIIVVAAVLGTRARLRYADQLREALARGEFREMGNPENKARSRRLFYSALAGLLGLLGIIGVIAVLILRLKTEVAGFYEIPIVIVLLLAVIVSILGFWMQREINRRL